MIIRIECIVASIVHGALEERCFLQSLQVLCLSFLLRTDGPLLAVKLEVVDGHRLQGAAALLNGQFVMAALLMILRHVTARHV